jgi:hypothetical protein
MASNARSSMTRLSAGRKSCDQVSAGPQLGYENLKDSASSSAAASKLEQAVLNAQASPLRASLGRLSLPGKAGVRSAAMASGKERVAPCSRMKALGASNTSISPSNNDIPLGPNAKDARGCAGEKLHENQPLMVKAQSRVARTKGGSPQVKVRTPGKHAAGTTDEGAVRRSSMLGSASPAAGCLQHMGYGTGVMGAKGPSGNWGEALVARSRADDGTAPKPAGWRKF